MVCTVITTVTVAITSCTTIPSATATTSGVATAATTAPATTATSAPFVGPLLQEELTAAELHSPPNGRNWVSLADPPPGFDHEAVQRDLTTLDRLERLLSRRGIAELHPRCVLTRVPDLVADVNLPKALQLLFEGE